MKKSLTFQEKLTKIIKRQKKLATTHVIIALIFAVILMTTLNFIDRNIDRSFAIEIQQEEDVQFTATMVGDVMLGRHVEEVIKRYGYDYLTKYFQPYFTASDYVTLNFEQPIVIRDEEAERADKKIHFKIGSEAATALKEMNVTTVNLANNHMIDYGQVGLEDTFRAFEEIGLEFVGAGRNLREAQQILYQTFDDITVATIGLADFQYDNYFATRSRGGILRADPSIFMPLVMEAKENADLVMVHVHWGAEYDNKPHPRQVEIGRALSDAGADIVIGHHPHVLQPIEVYNDTVIFYSLGNFIFDQGMTTRRETAIVQYKLDKEGKARVEVTPMWIREGRPRPITGILKSYRTNRIYNHLTKKLTEEDSWFYDGDKLTIELHHSHVIQ
ncbi:CapA family protein [Natronincola ferrireducens]|uniref:Poly-gamma-glutamate synthesis protein (Capsule biosynthesis protein) n=1 Tax=Natronincola ferrireducens TaxID=393762 RepID=A0A1G8XEZ7_9FIRM|nr:CapA family protein [Natronincola ferrireducens]SDJ89142.1 poly-gamma-glutamate synthesis protein (capsule biosynthesis protein) [Natronincola ferrireducens]